MVEVDVVAVVVVVAGTDSELTSGLNVVGVAGVVVGGLDSVASGTDRTALLLIESGDKDAPNS